MSDFHIADPIKDVVDTLGGKVPVAPAHGIAALALSMAMKYHDISTIQDGTLYQQFKLEGRNIQCIDIGHVFETAVLIERHLIASNERIASMLIEALEVIPDEPDDQTSTAPDVQP